jgi:hypothetical protein
LEATRVRFGSILEWLVAAAVCIAAMAAAATLYSELRTVRPVVPVMAGEALVHEAPAGIPARSISVPMLLLRNDLELRVGDAASDVAARLGGIATLVSESLDGVRSTRFYDALGTRFVIVLDAADRSGEPRISAIYRQ